jgi:beta-xylosidase
MRNRDIQIRDPFIVTQPELGRYLMFGTTDTDCWKSPGIGFDVYIGNDLQNWDGPFPAFRPELDFWATKNFWAPEVHSYKGSWYMFASFKSDSHVRATHILTANSPMGPYRPHSIEPLTPPQWECLDGTLYVDEEGEPWLVFCHEWVQVRDGEICALRLSRNLRTAIGDPVVLFKGSDAPWTRPHRRKDGSLDPLMRVTDGPFVHRTRNGGLLMLWSSFSDAGYAMGIAHSESGCILGPWRQEEKPVADSDSGHGMLFRDREGGLVVTWHSPNQTPHERPVFYRVEEDGGSIVIGGRIA